jgi:hypothetical protein
MRNMAAEDLSNGRAVGRKVRDESGTAGKRGFAGEVVARSLPSRHDISWIHEDCQRP